MGLPSPATGTVVGIGLRCSATQEQPTPPAPGQTYPTVATRVTGQSAVSLGITPSPGRRHTSTLRRFDYADPLTRSRSLQGLTYTEAFPKYVAAQFTVLSPGLPCHYLVDGVLFGYLMPWLFLERALLSCAHPSPLIILPGNQPHSWDQAARSRVFSPTLGLSVPSNALTQGSVALAHV